MAIHIGPPNENWQDDDGSLHRLYPIEDPPDLSTILYDKQPQRTSLTMANIVGVFNDWILSFFPERYFTDVRIRTQSAYSDFKSYMKNIYKREKPFLVIDPESVDNDDESVFTWNMLGRYNMYDPKNENVGAQMIYALDVAETDYFRLAFRRNRYKFSMNILIMEQTMDRQLNTYNNLIMHIRHNSKFMISRTVPIYLPDKHIQMIAHLHGYDYHTDEFVKFLNSVSRYPIIKVMNTRGQTTFQMLLEMNIRFEVPSLPSKDSPETSNAIEWGARITDSFNLNVDMPSEFILTVPEEKYTPLKEYRNETPEDITVVSPIYADLDWPLEINGYKATTKFDVMVQEGDDPSVDFSYLIRQYDQVFAQNLQEFMDRGGKLSDLILVKVYPNGSYEEAAYTVNDKCVLTLTNPIYDKIYTVIVYMNHHVMNLIREGKATEYLGTIQRDYTMT